MGVVLGTLTTKDGQVIPLPTAIDAIEEPSDEYRKEEEKKYSKCIRRPLTHGVWDSSWRPRPVTRPVASYLLKTQNLRLQGEGMEKKDIYGTNQYKVFHYIFKHPNVWLDTNTVSSALNLPMDSTSATMSTLRKFLRAEDFISEKEKDGTGGGKQIMFKAQCENADEESRIWYAKFLQDKRSKNKKPPAAKGSNPQPQAAAAPKAVGGRMVVEIDQKTMEAIVLVPLDKLASVLKLLTS